MSDKIKLPRVSPENLVEGEWYLVEKPYIRFKEFLLCRDYGFLGMGFSHGNDTIFCNSVGSDYLIYGPLPKFEIEEQ